MKINSLFPSVNYTVSQLTCHQFEASGRVNATLAVVRVCLFAFLEALVHIYAAIAKCAFAAVQLPIDPFLKETSSRLLLFEAGMHTLRAVKLVAVTTFIAIPGLISPQLLRISYERLGIIDASKPSVLSLSDRVQGVVTAALTSPRFKVLAGAVVFVVGSTAYGLAAYRSLYPHPPTGNSPITLMAVTQMDGALSLAFGLVAMLASRIAIRVRSGVLPAAMQSPPHCLAWHQTPVKPSEQLPTDTIANALSDLSEGDDKQIEEKVLEPEAINDLLGEYLGLDLPELLKDDGKAITRKQFLEKLSENIQRYAAGRDSSLTQESDIPDIQKGLLRVISYIKTLEQQDKREFLLGELAPVLLHCGDRTIMDLDRIYFTIIKASPDYVEGLTLLHKVRVYVQAAKRALFDTVVHEVTKPYIEDTRYARHYATTERYYMRCCYPDVQGAVQQTGLFENRTDDLCFKGLEEQVRKQWQEKCNSENIVAYFINVLQRPRKRCKLSEQFYEHIKEEYEIGGATALLSDDLLSWRKEAVALVLGDLGVLPDSPKAKLELFGVLKLQRKKK